MKKHTIATTLTRTESKRIRRMAGQQKLTVGVDLGDGVSHYCILDEAGQVTSRDELPTTKTGMSKLFEKLPPSRVVIEVGTHSPWVSRLLAGWKHEVIVANARKVKLITESTRKNDRIDAEMLARLGRVDPQLLSPIRHRGEEAHKDLAVIRARAELVEARTGMINCVRGLVKPMGERLKKCDADQVAESLGEGLSAGMREVVRPLLKSAEAVTEQIRECDKKIEEIAKRYPEVKLLTQVHGVGTLIALTFILTIEDVKRFGHSREVGPYVGLVPGQQDSGQSQRQMRISKTGDKLLRWLLVQGAQCILRKGAPDSDLRAWGLELQKSGGQRGRGRAAVGVARKLAVILHHLWDTGEVYDPLYNRKAAEAAAKKAAAKKAVA